MAGSVNKVILIGNLGRDPEARHAQDGSKIVNFTMATSESWKDKGSGERKEKTEWHRVVVFNDRLAGIAEQYLRKGSKVYIEGSLQTRKWTGNDGQERYTTEVVLTRFKGELTLLDSRGQGGGDAPGDAAGETGGRDERFSAGDYAAASGKGAGRPAPPNRAPTTDLDDEIPF
jgi:single-strand DNA-binding protein